MKLFAGVRESVGADYVEVEVQFPITVYQLKEAIAKQFESARSLLEFSRIAIDQEFAVDADVIDHLQRESVIALIPPVSGG